MITIKEMADMLGISTTTINNVIHGKSGQVSKATIEKVEKMIEEYDYVPNMTARNLAQNKSKIIGVAMRAKKDKYENTIQDPYVSEIIGAIERSIRSSEYFMMIYISDDIKEIIKHVSTWNVDGLILLGMVGDDCLQIKKKFQKPLVYIDSYFNNYIMEYVNIGLEDFQGSYDITKYLLDCGHKKIAFLADNCIGVDYERLNGYQKAMEETEVSYKEDFFFLISPEKQHISACLRALYDYSLDYTALVCASDYYAVLVMNYLRDRGRDIPGDISIVGFDDSPYSQIVRPALTTVHQNISEKGELAVKVLLRMLQGEEHKNTQIILPTQLMIRDTVKIIN
ncbi:MAG TPA: LacI family transcriptional regulator [Epulopiscium sp.]|nr:LacI family transcriptional regulator [Candidatus Epulonipiscium sp.]